MKRIILILFLTWLPLIQFGQIIADHTAVDKYDKIPQQYIDKVKKMLVDIAGESHSSGYRIGMYLLQSLNPVFQVTIFGGTPPSYSDQYLRFGGHGSVGEQHFFTTQTAIDTYKTVITSQYNTGNPFSVMGFGWCYDMTYLDFSAQLGPRDPVYNVRWYGISEGGADGLRPWGLDSGDELLTGNRVNLNTYLDAVEQYIKHCTDNGYPTKIIFTTGPVDNGSGGGPTAATETGFQREIKHDYIRNYVNADNSRILFDYADILCWNNSGEKYITNWNDGGAIRPHANIHPDNMMDYDASWNIIAYTEDGDHIGEVGALRLAKAMWWMLARIAGWDGGTPAIPVTGITVSGTQTISTDNGTTQLTATVSPVNATNQTVTWSINSGAAFATISPSGLVTAVDNGTVTARATANDGTGIYGERTVTITNQIIPVTGITVSGTQTISTNNGTTQLTATVSPVNATNQTVTWSINSGAAFATISPSGLVTASDNGTVTARATANDGTGIYGERTVTITNQIIPVTGITVSGTQTIGTDNGTTQLTATVSPVNATNQTVTWSISSGASLATISSSGLVTATDNGTVIARATANDGTGIYGERTITITNQVIAVSSISLTGTGELTTILSDHGTLQLIASVLPLNATNKTVTWSIAGGTGQGTITNSGLVTALANGTIIARATANDGSGIYETITLTVSFPTDIIVRGLTTDLIKIIVTRDEIRMMLNKEYISWRDELYDIWGRLLLSKIVDSEIIKFDISSLSSGIYMVVLTKGDNRRVVKVIKP